MSDNYITGGQEPPQDYLNLDGALEYLVHQGMGAALLGSTDITYSTGRGDACYRVSGTLTGGAGGAHAFYSFLTLTGALTDAGAGVVGAKSVVRNTAHQSDGNIYAGQFIAIHTHATNHMHAEACLIGLEAIGYGSGDAGVGVMIGANVVIRSYALAAYAGGVHRAIQVIVDEATLGATEVTALCIWNMGASAIGGIRIVGAATMANFLYLDAFGGAAIAATRHGSGGVDILCDAYLVCSVGGVEYDIPLYNS
jgi:hypothetical protein